MGSDAHNPGSTGTKVRRVVRFPTELVRSTHALRPQEILCYGLLQVWYQVSQDGESGAFKWAELRELTGLDLRTLKRAVRALVESRWVSLSQEHRKAPIRFRLQHADYARMKELRERLSKAEHRGEAMMQFYLSLVVDSRESEDNARPEFLVNPATGERLELDRYYPVHRVAFEFNGPQHYAAEGRFTKEEVAAQRKRDHVKRRICKEKGIDLVVVHADDLTLAGMLRKVGDRLPRRSLRGLKWTLAFINECGQRYRAAVARARAGESRSPADLTSKVRSFASG